MSETWRVVLGVVVLVCGIFAFAILPTHIWNTRSQSGLPDGSDASLTAKGSVAWSWYFLYGRATWPSIRVELDEIALRISPGSRWFAWYVPSVTLPWVQMESIAPTGRGITIRMPNKPGQMRVVLWEGSLVGELQRLGVRTVE